MLQTVLKEHNLDPAIKSNIALNTTSKNPPNIVLVSTAFMLFMLFTPTLNLDSTSNLVSTFNISADTVKPTEFTKASESTKVIESIITKVTVIVVLTVKPTKAIEEKKATLDQLLNCAYENDSIPSKVLKLLA